MLHVHVMVRPLALPPIEIPELIGGPLGTADRVLLPVLWTEALQFTARSWIVYEVPFANPPPELVAVSVYDAPDDFTPPGTAAHVPALVVYSNLVNAQPPECPGHPIVIGIWLFQSGDADKRSGAEGARGDTVGGVAALHSGDGPTTLIARTS